MGKSARFRRQDDELGGAHAAPVIYVFLDEVGRASAVVARGANEFNHVSSQGFADWHHADQLLEIENLFRGGDRIDLRDMRGGGQIDHLHFVVGAQIIEDGIEQEAIELRFGQRVRAFELDGVLRGQHEEGNGQLVIVPTHGAGQLLHGLEQRRLRLWRRAINFVGQHDVPEDRPRDEGPAPVARGGILLDDVRSGDVGGHQVRRELDALEYQAERLGNRADHERLRRAGQAGDQAMAAYEKRDENLVEHFLLPDDNLADLREDVVPHRLKAFNALFQFRGIGIELNDGGHWVISLHWNPSVAAAISERAESWERPPATRGGAPQPYPFGPPRNTRVPD